MNQFRWWLAKQLNKLAWAITPEPQRSMLRRDFDEAFVKIVARHPDVTYPPKISI